MGGAPNKCSKKLPVVKTAFWDAVGKNFFGANLPRPVGRAQRLCRAALTLTGPSAQNCRLPWKIVCDMRCALRVWPGPELPPAQEQKAEAARSGGTGG